MRRPDLAKIYRYGVDVLREGHNITEGFAEAASESEVADVGSYAGSAEDDLRHRIRVAFMGDAKEGIQERGAHP